jgi:hypothetical protein
MTHKVIAAFRDLRTGECINPGDPLPEGLDEDIIERLVTAKCLKPIAGADLFGGEGSGGDGDDDDGDGNDGDDAGEGKSVGAGRKAKAKK